MMKFVRNKGNTIRYLGLLGILLLLESAYFIKKQAVAYIFNSRIAQKSWHIKYRYDLMKAVNNP